MLEVLEPNDSAATLCLSAFTHFYQRVAAHLPLTFIQTYFFFQACQACGSCRIWNESGSRIGIITSYNPYELNNKWG